MPEISSHLAQLTTLLEKRINVIADHAFRDRDAAAHLQALKDVSEAIEAEHQKHRSQLPARLRHFLEQASYQKALAFLKDEPVPGPH